jgi:hypothetical protein
LRAIEFLKVNIQFFKQQQLFETPDLRIEIGSASISVSLHMSITLRIRHFRAIDIVGQAQYTCLDQDYYFNYSIIFFGLLVQSISRAWLP